MLVLLWLFAGLTASVDCGDRQLGYVFGECKENRTRSAFFYWKEECNGTLPKPVQGLNCDLDCPAGTYLSLDVLSRRSACSECPENTYNIGGGEVVSGSQGDWAMKRSRFSSYCWTTDWLDWVEGKECTPWTVGGGGRTIVSGESGVEHIWVSSSLVYYANLLAAGNCTVRYSKVTRMLNGFRNGALSVTVNSKVVLRDDSLNRNHWEEMRVGLEQGPNEIVVEFEKYNAKGQEDVSAKLDLFEVRGTALSSHFCYPCEDGTSPRGSDHCTKCPANDYLDRSSLISQCLPCPHTHYSLEGSVTAADCKMRDTCTESDYHATYSPCKDGRQTKVYIWNEPMVCAPGVDLPSQETGLTCELCSPGEYHSLIGIGTSECRPCPNGTSLTEMEVTHDCIQCIPGTYAPKVWNLTRWTEIPGFFGNVCVPREGDVCQSRHGWVPFESYISTGNQPDPSCEVVLSRTVTITEIDSFVTFQVSLANSEKTDSKLIFEIDGVEYQAFTSSHRQTLSSSIHLDIGVRMLKWIYRRDSSVANPKDSASIHWISVSGLSEGGSPSCAICPIGHYSGPSSESCQACPAGHTHSLSHQGCELCPGQTYSDQPGVCKPCPDFTRPSQDHTKCIGEGDIFHMNRHYSIRNLTGVAEDGSELKQWACTSNQRMKLFCSGSLYGPVVEGWNSYYLSVLNPGSLATHRYTHLDDSQMGYAWGVVNKEELESLQEKDLNAPDDACIADYSKIVVNLGSKVSSVTGSQIGFTISYSDGSFCSKSGSDRFSSEIAFSCDKAEGDGWPILVSDSQCEVRFLWKTKYACEVCEMDEMEKVVGTCSGGRRTIRARETETCIFADDSFIWEESCSTSWDLIMSLPGLIGCVLLIALLGTASVLFVCFCKVKRQYTLLVEGEAGAIELT